MHQWIGVFGGLLATYHLILHWDWVISVTVRLFGKTSAQGRIYYLLDAAIMIGFYLIGLTGIIISTWLNLTLTNYAVWVDFHVTTSILTLILIVLKIGLRWRWIVRVARQSMFTPVPQPVLVVRTTTALKPATVSAAASGAMTRRDFLKLMGTVGIASLAAVSFTWNDDQESQTDPTAADSSLAKDGINTQSTTESVIEASPTVSTDTVSVSQADSPQAQQQLPQHLVLCSATSAALSLAIVTATGILMEIIFVTSANVRNFVRTNRRSRNTLDLLL